MQVILAAEAQGTASRKGAVRTIPEFTGTRAGPRVPCETIPSKLPARGPVQALPARMGLHPVTVLGAPASGALASKKPSVMSAARAAAPAGPS